MQRCSSKRIIAVLVLTLFAIATAGPCFAGDPDPGGVNWYSYDEGIKKIKSGDKIGFLHFYTDWCTYCKMMVKQTFSDKKVSDYLNANFIPIRVNADEEKAVAKEYGVNRYPSNWFLASDGREIANRPGFIPPEQMIQMLKYLHSGSYETMSFSDYLEKQE